MRFQTSKVIPREDPQIVLRALAVSLRQISLDVVLDGPEIILHGLGPSPRIINPCDATILRVETEGHQTIINADITFQPSCLLGESPQDAAVRDKLDHVFAQMAAEIELELQRKSQPLESSRTAGLPLIFTDTSEVASPPPSVELPWAPSPISRGTQFDPATESRSTELAPSEEIKPNMFPHVDLPRTLAIRPTLRQTLLITHTVVALALCFFVARHSKTVVNPSTGISANQTVPLSVKSQTSIHSIAQSVTNVADPRAWLEDWVAALRTSDPIAQASFYADPLDDYLSKRNLSNTRMVAEKKRAIEHRVGLWTIKLEKIIVSQESSASVTVHLRKHIIAQTKPFQISEQFVKCRLRLKRVSGQWKISSEEDLM